jgi:Domain of Unknown Function with PDB structure (DUF3857)/Transglutaminase-like superfamily
MKIQKVFIALFLIIFSFAKAQKLELGKVSIAELEEKQNFNDPTAVATFLFKKGEVQYTYSQTNGFEMTTEVKAKIKIYKKEGYEWANTIISYYVAGSSRESVSISDAVTYNLVNGKIEKSKLKSDGIFDEKINKYWNRKKIAMPNVKEGSVIEYSYTINSPRIGELKDWNFQHSIPVNYSEFKTYIPEYFIYKPTQKGFLFPKVTVEKIQKSISYNYKPTFTAGGNNSTSLEKLNFEETQTTYLAFNLPAMKDEAFVNNIDNYTSIITHELSSIKFPNSPYKNYSTDWETVTKKIYEADDFGSELNKTGYFEDDVKTLIAGISDRDEKIAIIFNFVKSKVKWNDFTGYSCNDSVKKAYKDGVGNVAEINLMLTAMLRFAGIDANPVILSTRSNGIALFPSLSAFNYVISAVEIENDLILLDATEKFAVPNILPNRDLNWLGRLIRKNGTSSEVELMPKKLSGEYSLLNYKLDPKGAIEGNLRRQFTNHNALSFRKNFSAVSKESYLENLENKNNNIEINDYVRENETDFAKPIIESFNFKDSKSFEIINDKIYISPLAFLTEKENPFKQEVREYPLDFGFPTNDQFIVNITIPDGYKVESMPKSVNLASGENVAAFKYLILNEDNNINIVASSSLNEAIVPADFYDIIKDFYRQMIEKQNEKIVLVKK